MLSGCKSTVTVTVVLEDLEIWNLRPHGLIVNVPGAIARHFPDLSEMALLCVNSYYWLITYQ